MPNKNNFFQSNKILAHIDKIKDWLENQNPLPVTVDLDLTNRCNNNCLDCIGARKPLVDLKNPLDIIVQIASLNIKSIIFSGGGEPTLHPEFVRSIELAYRKRLEIGLTTNGLILTKNIAKQIKPYCTWIRISFTADRPTMYQKIHRIKKRNFYTVQKNISDLVKLKGKSIIGIGYLTGKQTINGMLQATKNAKKLGVDYIEFRPFVDDFTEINTKLYDCKKLENEKFRVLFAEQKYERVKCSRDFGKCYGQQFVSIITATGDMYICCHWRGAKKAYLGNVHEKSIYEIWNSEQRQKAIDNINFRECKKRIKVCRLSSCNKILWDIKQAQKINHKNFL